MTRTIPQFLCFVFCSVDIYYIRKPIIYKRMNIVLISREKALWNFIDIYKWWIQSGVCN